MIGMDSNESNPATLDIKVDIEEKSQCDLPPPINFVTSSTTSTDIMIVNNHTEINTEMQSKLVKLFDGALHDIHRNLTGAFRFMIEIKQGLQMKMKI